MECGCQHPPRPRCLSRDTWSSPRRLSKALLQLTKAGTTRRWCNPLPSCRQKRSQHHQCQAEAHLWPVIGFTLSRRESYASSGVRLPPPHGIVTQTSPLHVGVTESMQSADAEHVVMAAVVATIVLPVKGIVEDIAASSSTGAVDISMMGCHIFGTCLLLAETWRHGPECR